MLTNNFGHKNDVVQQIIKRETGSILVHGPISLTSRPVRVSPLAFSVPMSSCVQLSRHIVIV